MTYRRIIVKFIWIGLLFFLTVVGILVFSRNVGAIPPGIPVTITDSPLESLLAHQKSINKLTFSTSETQKRADFINVGIQFLDPEKHLLLVYLELADKVYGLPAVVPFKEFTTYKFLVDCQHFLLHQLGQKIDPLLEESEGLLNVKIPVKVPKRLSAITGEGATNLSITGRRRIEFSGLSQYTLGEAQTVTRTSRFPTIRFEQESQLNVQGTIGDRITIALEQNSQSQLDLAESLRLQYRGDENGIIDVIEAGNTTLSLPGTRLIGFSAQGRGGLFGIKAKGRVGGVNFTVVTSQDKGSSNRKTFQGQAEETAHTVRDFQYLEDTYFFLDTIYRNSFQTQNISENDLIDIQSVRVFLNDFNDINDIEDRAISAISYAFWNPDGNPDEQLSQSQNGGKEEGSFHELARKDFTVYQEGYLIMNLGRINPGFALAMAFRTRDGRTFGDLSFIPDPNNVDSKIKLKLIKGRQQRPDSPTWPLSWRNVYSLGGRRIEAQGFLLGIYQEVSGQEPLDNQKGTPYLQIFNLDSHTNGASASSPPDNLIDIDGGNNLPGLNLPLGHLIFPTLEPFGSQGVGANDLDEKNRVPEIYNTINTTTRSEKSKFFMRILSKSQASEFNLGLGIIENSEVVRLNNRTLEKGKDYSIDYNFGRIRFLGTAANDVSDPSNNLQIDYGSKSLFGFGQQKSLLGLRFERPFEDKFSQLGLTILYSNQSTPSQRIRVGQEPASSMIWDANARFRFRPQILTDAINILPFVDTGVSSSIDFDAEIAQSLPNPNTKGVAYIDDFEGAQNSLSFGIGKLVWAHPSTPTHNLSPINLPKGRLTWYNPVERDRVSILNIQPNRDDISIDQSIVEILFLRYEPHRTNGFPERTNNTKEGLPEPSWAGIMRNLGGFDLSRSKFLELWIRGNAGHLHFDIGEISERLTLPLDHPVHNPVPTRFRTEDKSLGGLPTGDNVATVEEDIGLDGLTDSEEANIFSKIYPGTTHPSDPSRDNFLDVNLSRTNIHSRYPTGVNGTQGNSPERSSLPDTEDLNRNGILDVRENYIRYSINLATNQGFNRKSGNYDGPSVLIEGSQSNLIPEGEANPPWRLIRIPLKGRDAPRIVEGQPDTTFSSAIDYIRLWIEHNDTTSVQIYTFDVVGSDWQEDPVPFTHRSGDFQVSNIGTDNPIYESPPGLRREVDPISGLRMLERSLSLEFENLYPEESITTSRTFLQGDDYTRYGALTMFVHGGNPANLASFEQNFPAPEDTLSNPSPVELFLRFSPIGEDTLNFYEYQTKVYRGWAIDINTVRINLELMSQLKGQLLDLQTTGQTSTDTLTLNLQQGSFAAKFSKEENRIEIKFKGKTYIVRGNPALSNIKSFTIGLRNKSNQILNGKNEIWVNELRVDNIRKKSALSALLDVRTTFADLGNLSVNLERKSGDFQDLQGNASGQTTTRLSLDSQINLDKFLPLTWNTTIPVRFSYNRFSSIPRIRRGSDIVLTPEQKRSENDVRSQTRLNISLRKRAAKEAPRILSRILFDRINASFNLISDNSMDGAITRRRSNISENLNGTFSYDLSLPQRHSLQLLSWFPFIKSFKQAKFFYFPSSLRYNARFSRSLRDQKSFSAVAGDTSDVIDTLNENFTISESYSVKLNPFRSLSADYDLAINRDLRNGYSPSQLQFGRETSRTQNTRINYNPRIFTWLTISPSYTANYRETLETGGQRTTYGKTRRGLTIFNENTASARASLNLPTFFRLLTKPSRGKKSEKISLLKIIGTAGTFLQNVTGNVSRSKTFNTYGLRNRPSFKYQFGFSDTARVEGLSVISGTRTNTRVTREQANATSGIRLPGGFSISSGANYTHSQSFGNANSEDEGVTFPKVDISWRGLERLPLLRILWSNSNTNFGYKKNRTRRGDGGLNDQSITSNIQETSFSPLYAWTARWKNQMSTTVRGVRTRQNAINYQRNVASDSTSLQDRLIGTTKTETSSISSDLRYSIRSRFQQSLDLTIGYQRSSNQQTEQPRSISVDAPVDLVIRQNTSDWSVQLGAQYAFSRSFTGGINFRHGRRKDRLRDLTNVSWEFRFWGDIGFQ